jgi:hypothetical protein
MKTQHELFTTIALAALLFVHPQPSSGQTNLNFNGISANVEGAIRMSWNSTPGEIYEIDEADSLIDTNTGTITWNVLYENYPSQGTNTFWLDTGNYFADREIVHPRQSPMRFYRIVLTGTNETPTVPVVAVVSPINNDSLDGDVAVTVSAYSDQPFLSTKLYVDGQEMNEADSSTNWTDISGITNYIQDTYIINTCEWTNGSHTLFATARVQTGASGTHDVGGVGIGYGVSGFVPVTFSNLITRISFSQPFLTPEDGQTQHVSAVFAANVDWTLEIQDVNEANVLTVTGSGGTLSYDWDGTGTGGTNLPTGTYTYLITATTNGLALPSGISGGGEGGGSPPSPGFAEFSMLWAMPLEGSSDVVPLELYPPGFDTNYLTIFEATPSELTALRSAVMGTPKRMLDSDESSGAASPAYSGGSSQNSRAPKRPPINPVKGRAGVYGIAYDTYSANGTGFTIAPPDNGLHINQRIQLEGHTAATSTFLYKPLREYKQEANAFIAQMKKNNWSQGFAKVDDQFSINDLRGSSTIFNGVKLGVLMLHGTYGTSLDYNANQTRQIYFPITAGHSATYLRANEMSLGSSATNGLKWMAIAACNSLFHSSWTTMQNGGALPYNGNLHLILGTDTVAWTGEHVVSYWAKYITVGQTNGSSMTVKDGWIAGARQAYLETHFNYTNAIKFAVSGDSACQGDKLQSYSDPGGSSFYVSTQVWP